MTSIRSKLLLFVLTVTGLSLAAGAVISVLREQRDTERELILDIGTEARLVAGYCGAALASSDPHQVSEGFKNITFSSDVEHAALISPSGQFLAVYGDSLSHGHYQELESGKLGVRRVDDHVVATYPAEYQGRIYGYVHVHSSASRVGEQLSEQLKIAVAVTIVLALLSLVAAVFLQKLISRPLISLSEVVRRVAKKGDLSVEIGQSTSRDEIGQLSDSFRDMLSMLRAREKSKERAEKALQLSEEKFRQLFTELTSGLALHEMVYDEHGRGCDYRFLEVNQAFERLTGLRANEIIGRTVREVIPQIEELWIERYAQVAATGEPTRFSFASEPLGRHYQVTAYSPRLGQFATIFDDITDRINAEQNLRLFKTISDQAGHGASYADIQGNLVYINDAYLRMLGYTREEVIGKNIRMFHPDDVQPSNKKLREMLFEESPLTAVQRIHLRKDGTTFPGLTNLAIIPGADGKPLYISATTIDITELARAEEKARAERDRAQRYLNVAATPMVIIAADQSISMINRTGCQMLGYQEKELIGKNWFDTCLPAADRSQVKEVFDRLMAGEMQTTGYFENSVLTKSGDLRHLGWYNTVLVDEQGHITGTLSSGIDLTERKWAAEVMRTIVEGTSASVGEDFFRHLVSRLATSLGCRFAMVGELYGEGNTQVKSVGRWISDDFGSTVMYDLAGTPCSDVIDQGTCYIDSGLRQQYPHSRFLQELIATWYLGVRLEDSKGVPLGVMTLMGDRPLADVDLAKSLLRVFAVRAATEIERQRSNAQREELVADLETKNAELERFTYTVSHDLKSPIITILGFLGLLKKDISEGREDRIDQDLARVANAATKMQSLLDELLRLSRIGRQVNATESVSLYEVAREAEELLASQIESAGAQIEISPDLPTILGDRPRLHEVLQNLLDNALKYRADTENLTVHIGVRHSEGQSVIFVKDNGMGIPPQYHHKVFELFDKLNPQSEGTGVGLALVKRIVEQHNGRIWIESEGLGHGTCFCFTIGDGIEEEGRTNGRRTAADSSGRR